MLYNILAYAVYLLWISISFFPIIRNFPCSVQVIHNQQHCCIMLVTTKNYFNLSLVFLKKRRSKNQGSRLWCCTWKGSERVQFLEDLKVEMRSSSFYKSTNIHSSFKAIIWSVTLFKSWLYSCWRVLGFMVSWWWNCKIGYSFTQKRLVNDSFILKSC